MPPSNTLVHLLKVVEANKANSNEVTESEDRIARMTAGSDQEFAAPTQTCERLSTSR